MTAVVVGTREYAWAVAIFARLFGKYHGGEVVWYGDGTPDVPKGVEFRPCPAYPEAWPWERRFGAGLVSIMQDLESDVFTLFLPDHWIAEPVDVGLVKRLGCHVAKGNILRCDLTRGACAATYGKLHRRLKGVELWEVPRDSPHCSLQVTFSPALWHRRIFEDVLERHWTLWETEVLGSRRVAGERLRYEDETGIKAVSVAAVPGPVVRCHGIYRGEEISVDGLNVEDAAMVKSMLPGGWKCRS